MKRFFVVLTIAILGLNFNAYAEKASDENHLYLRRMQANKKFSAEFNEPSFEALAKEYFKNNEMPASYLVGFAIYDVDDNPSIAIKELKAGKNEYPLPLDMSCTIGFDAAKQIIYTLKLKSDKCETSPQADFYIPKEFLILTKTTLPLLEKNEIRFINIVVFSFNNLDI